jgi:hypothetical protein
MKTHILSLLLFTLAFTGCGTPYQGIKMRVQSPMIEEGFRKTSLAITTDGYQIETVLPAEFQLETRWREAKDKELSKSDRALGAKQIECRLSLRMQERGKLYDVFLTPMLKYSLQDGAVKENIAGPTHPLRDKWEEVFRRLLEREHKDED